jgi:hypothetical protein
MTPVRKRLPAQATGKIALAEGASEAVIAVSIRLESIK